MDITTTPTTPPRKPSVTIAVPERITMRILAERLGVTKATVSLALRDNQCVSKSTRERVQKLANELHYRPDPAVSAIASQRWSCRSSQCHRIIAFLCRGDSHSLLLQHMFFKAAQKRADELGYRLEPFNVDKYPDPEAVTRVLYTRGIRGIIVPPIMNPDSHRLMHLDWSKFTAVCCGVGRVKPPLHTVSSDVFATTRFVWETVARAGYKKVGAALFCHEPKANDDWHRVGATSAALRFLELDQFQIPIHTSDNNDEKSLLAWYEKYRPEVIVGFNHHVGVLLEKNGVRMPEDVAFVCLRTEPGTKWSGVLHHDEQIAVTSVDILRNELRENRWGLPPIPHMTLIQPEWNEGSTFIAEGKETGIEQGENIGDGWNTSALKHV